MHNKTCGKARKCKNTLANKKLRCYDVIMIGNDTGNDSGNNPGKDTGRNGKGERK